MQVSVVSESIVLDKALIFVAANDVIITQCCIQPHNRMDY